MPNQRRAGQTLISFACEEDLAAEIDRARGGDTRSQLIRRALVAYLEAQGLEVDARLVDAPDRVGVGGRPKKGSASYRKTARKSKAKKKDDS